MSWTDCPKCWDTPCTCGHEGYVLVPMADPDLRKKYVDSTMAKKADIRDALKDVLRKKLEE